MALTLDATVGGAAANSYATEVEANAYFDGRRNASAWTGAATGAGLGREQALVAATSRLEQERFKGEKTDRTGQALKWPRRDVLDEDGYLYDSAALPIPLKVACYELALHLLNAGTVDPLIKSGLSALEDVSIGPLRVKPAREVPGALPAQVLRLIGHLFSTAPGTVRTVRA